MDEHNELVAEIPDLEKLSAQARLERAKERRRSQLLRWENRVLTEDIFPPAKKRKTVVEFQPNITLIEAAARNDAEEVIYLIQSGYSCDLQNDDGLSALHQAVIEDCEDVVHALVESGASLNIKDADLWTPLHAAVACGNFDLVSYLVEKGASLVEINADGNMPIDLCEDNEDIEKLLDETMAQEYTEDDLENIRNHVADEMLQDLRESVIHGRDLNLKDTKGATAMHIAAANGYLDVLEYLVEHEAAIDATDHDGWQPIHAAACWGQDKSIELLFQHGADLDAKTNLGESPFDLSEDEDLVEMMKELKESGRKTKDLKRSQSNSSRTLCVRRSSIVDKHRMSLDDAKSEGKILQSSPDYKEVFLNTESDNVDNLHPVNSHGENEKEGKRTSMTQELSKPKQNEVIVNEVQKQTTYDISKKPLRPPSFSKTAEVSGAPRDVAPAEPEWSVAVKLDGHNMKTEFKKETIKPDRHSKHEEKPAALEEAPKLHNRVEQKQSAPIAKRDSDTLRRDAQSPSGVVLTFDDTSAPVGGADNATKSKNTAVKKTNNADSKSNGLPKKKCCVIL